ncbi:NUDIX domain-containing protein [Flexivirga endophytica]|nr:NUDIX domain-containing protein [Flexivirga endophytica]
MSHWSPEDARVLALPSGRLVRGRGLSAHPEVSPDPDFGLYLLAESVHGVPWHHTWIEWTDFGLPVDPTAAREALTTAWQRAAYERVEIACLGGLGRTGTALACLAVLDGLPPDTAIDLVRARYDTRAIETPEQVEFVSEFASAQPAPTDATVNSTQSRATRVGAYAVCIHDGSILLSHQISAGPAQGKWTLPGGGVDFGEEPAGAAIRECREESGLVPELGQVLGIHSNTYESSDGIERHGIRILYRAVFAEGRPEPMNPNDGEIDQVGWFALDDLPSPITDWARLGCRLATAVPSASV